MFQKNTDFLINQLKNLFIQDTLYPSFISKKKFTFPMVKDFRNIQFLPHFYQFLQWLRCAIFQININLLVIQQNINIFTQETLYTSFNLKKKLALSIETFFETSIFYHIFTIQDLFQTFIRCDYLTQSSALSFEKIIFVKNG